MPVLLQINVTSNWGSTGKIVEQIGVLAEKRGWKSYVAYGRYANVSKLPTIKIGNMIDVYEHYIENRLFDREGLASRYATYRLLKNIDRIKPDIIHLHNIHDHYLNYRLLFTYLKEKKIPTIWTQHDCWSFTGGCCYYSLKHCLQWKQECVSCKNKRGLFYNRTALNFKLKKKLFTSVDKLVCVPVSMWLMNELRQSFLNKFDIYPILNGVDVDVFQNKPSDYVRSKYGIGKRRFLVGVASVWSERKGYSDYLKLASILKEYVIVLVGLSGKQMKNLPTNIIGIPRTQNIDELVALYSEAEIVLNLSSEETFGLTTVEGFACGTPGIVYNCTASPELITHETGRIVNEGDLEGVATAVKELLSIEKASLSKACRSRALAMYDKNKNYTKYISLYNNLLIN